MRHGQVVAGTVKLQQLQPQHKCVLSLACSHHSNWQVRSFHRRASLPHLLVPSQLIQTHAAVWDLCRQDSSYLEAILGKSAPEYFLWGH